VQAFSRPGGVFLKRVGRCIFQADFANLLIHPKNRNQGSTICVGRCRYFSHEGSDFKGASPDKEALARLKIEANFDNELCVFSQFLFKI
jgi:hypothetical protein